MHAKALGQRHPPGGALQLWQTHRSIEHKVVTSPQHIGALHTSATVGTSKNNFLLAVRLTSPKTILQMQ